MQLHTITARRAFTAASIIALAALASACGAGDQPASGDIATGPAEGDVTITARDNEFSPETLQVPAGQTAVTITNTGDAPHNFVIDELDVSSGTIEPGGTVTASFELPSSGVAFVCTFHGGMDGRIEAAP